MSEEEEVKIPLFFENKGKQSETTSLSGGTGYSAGNASMESLQKALHPLAGDGIEVNPWFSAGGKPKDHNAGGTYLLRESGLASNLIRNTLAVVAAKDPIAGMAAYTKEVMDAGELHAAVYQKDFEKLFQMGLPANQCEAIAMQKAKNALRDQLAIVGLSHPLAANPNILASAAAGVPLNVTSASKLTKEEKRAIYKKYKAKKGKKSAK